MKKAKVSKNEAKVVKQAAQEESPKQIVEEEEEEEEEELLDMNFSLQVAKHVINENIAKGESVVCSPASIDTVLRILAVGAENSTLAQLLELLGHADVHELNKAASKLATALKSSDKKDAPEISYVNALWLDQRFSLKAGFEKVLMDVHNVRARVVDFVNHGDKVVEEANAWTTKETKGLIKQLLTKKNINDETMLLLANALYFKGNWVKYFESDDTEDDVFNLLDGHKVRVPFMNQWSEYFEYGTYMNSQVIRMAYKSKESIDYAMYIFLPNEKDGLPHLMKNINLDESLFEDLDLNFEKVAKLSIPKFKFVSDISVKETLIQLGLTLPFEENCSDFSGIVGHYDDEPLYVSNIIQKCYVETNEQGTKAAAVTYGGLRTMMARPSERPPPEIKFVADHPFMFMITEDVSGATLFVGTMLDPR